MPDPAERKTGRALLRRLALDTLGRTPSLAEAQAFLDAPVDLVAKRLVASLGPLGTGEAESRAIQRTWSVRHVRHVRHERHDIDVGKRQGAREGEGEWAG
jgi:hypothetical protein